MKRKQFEKIVPKYEGTMKESGQASYLMDAFIQNDILAVDFYRALPDEKWKILWRTVISDKEFFNYKYSSKCWDEKKLESIASECEWMSAWGREVGKSGKEYELAEGAKEIIEEGLRKIDGTIWRDEWYSLKSKESNISVEKRYTAEERKFQRIQKKMAEAPALPEDFKEFITNKLFRYKHILYFSKEKAYCTRCGKTVRMQKKIKHNAHGICPKCEREVTYKSVGRMRKHEENKEVLLIQKRGSEVILRYFRCSLLSEFEKKEDLEFSESVCTYHDKGIEWYKNRYVHYTDNMHGGTFWSDKMYQGSTVAYGNRCCLYSGNLEEIHDLLEEKVNLPIKELAEEGIEIPWKYILMGQSAKNEIFEKIYKSGLHRLAIEYIQNHEVSVNYRVGELRRILMITKPMLDYMREHDSNSKVLKVLQDAKKDNCGLNDAEIFELAEAGIMVSELKKVAAGSRLIRTLHYLQRVKGYSNLKTTYSHYTDYIGMVQSMGYDMEKGTVRYPKELRAAHDKAVSDFYEGETDKKKQQAMKKYPMIAALAAGLSVQYGYRDKNYMIVVPKNAGDIVEEGRTLHHCVGGDNYLSKHNQGRSYIVFLRKCATPEKRYYTIEIDPEDNRIVQYYGYNDKKPDKESVDKFLNKWKKHLSNQENKNKVAVPAAGKPLADVLEADFMEAM